VREGGGVACPPGVAAVGAPHAWQNVAVGLTGAAHREQVFSAIVLYS